MDQHKDNQEYLPLREATFFIILSLAPGPKHGYAILKEVESLSEGRIVLSTGTLYGAIKRLLRLGWIERKDSLTDPQNGRERKSYALTKSGNQILNAEVSRLKKLVDLAQPRVVEETS
jgi:DNA-binding PadR family transcriptional regulator